MANCVAYSTYTALAPTCCGCSNLPHSLSSTSPPSASMEVMPSVSPKSLVTSTFFCTRISSYHGELRRKFLPSIISGLCPSWCSPQKVAEIQHAMPDQPPKEPFKLSGRWREIQGEKHWEGLLEHPIDATLRAEIIRYGEFAQVCYDAFDFNEHSLYCGSCKYNKATLFEKVDKWKCGYDVTKYLYATSKLDLPKFFKTSKREEERRWSRDSNWIGYVAVCTDDEEIKRQGRRDILIAWRGTVTKTEWAEDLRAIQTPANIEQKLLAMENLQIHVGGDDARAVSSQFTQNKELCLSEIVKVESGFLSLYSSSKAKSRFNKLSAGQQVAMEVMKLLQKYQGEELSITITGHSLGAALALLCAYDLAANVAPSLNLATAAPLKVSGEANPLSPSSTAPNIAAGSLNVAAQGASREIGGGPRGNVMITVFAFAGPRVGNRVWKRRLEEVGVRVLRVVNIHDCVPKVPGVIFNEHWPDAQVWSNYHHVGKELLIDFDYSPHLRHTRELPSHHNLEAYLHILDGFHGINNPFQSVFGRSPVLVNKSSDFLMTDSHIPPCWWQESNKGLIKDPSGQWVLASREEDHLPEPHTE